MKLIVDGRLTADNIAVADSFFTRLRGLMFRRGLEDGEGLLLRDCQSIHCCFMRFAIDAVYLDKDMRILAVEALTPWRMGGIHKGTRHVLELRSGAAADMAVGTRVTIADNI